MKLYQFDKKIWDNDEIDYTWQLGIIKNRALVWINFTSPGGITHSSGGIHILLCLFTSSSPFGFDLQQNRFSFGIHFLSEYFEGWDT